MQPRPTCLLQQFAVSSASPSDIRASGANKQRHQHAWLQPRQTTSALHAALSPPPSRPNQPSGKAGEGADEHDEPATSADGEGGVISKAEGAADVAVNGPNVGGTAVRPTTYLPAAGSQSDVGIRPSRTSSGWQRIRLVG
ncbi:hypothetical protein LY76DRAFT_332631 [Colletotrichum caudatum]|nr:hypothetical protein LY76DRAFT_332631 [Colletotrichum caudatum]